MTQRVSQSPCERRWKVEKEADAIYITQSARELAAEHGFSTVQQSAISIALSEAVHNILRHATSGFVCMWVQQHPTALVWETWDQGSGFFDLELAMQDGISEGMSLADRDRFVTQKGLGSGLGAICRMMDEVHFENIPTGGALVRATKFLTPG
jgi:anti-sigma regulatory factor (Ser/Thr protein kinase)